MTTLPSRKPMKATLLALSIAILGISFVQLLIGSHIFSQKPSLRLPVQDNSERFRSPSTPEQKLVIHHPRAAAAQNTKYNRKFLPAFDPNNSNNGSPQYPYGGAFVHIGKTGGSTLSVLLRNGCHSYMKHPCYNISQETAASLLIDSYYHVPDFAFLQQSDHDFYLITARDPLDRTISAFVFEHLQNRDARNEPVDSYKRRKYEMAYQCFPTLESFCRYLKGNSSDFSYPYHKKEVHPESCKDLARAALHGKVKLYNHFFFGFDRIRTFIPQAESRRFYVARQEQLWSDWQELNQILEATFELPSPAAKAYAIPQAQGADRRNTTVWELREQLPIGKNLSPIGVKSLCRALEKEYRAFFWLLHKAENIQEQHFQFSLDKAKERCGESLDLDLIAAEVRSPT